MLITLFNIIIFSSIPHKEFRFILPLMPMVNKKKIFFQLKHFLIIILIVADDAHIHKIYIPISLHIKVHKHQITN